MVVKFEKPTPEIIAFFESIAPTEPNVTRLKMFGNPCCFVNGNMFMGIHNNRMILRLSESDRTKFLDIGGKIFEPMPDHFMKEYVLVPRNLVTVKEISQWVHSSFSYASKLSAKSNAKRKTK